MPARILTHRVACRGLIRAFLHAQIWIYYSDSRESDEELLSGQTLCFSSKMPPQTQMSTQISRPSLTHIEPAESNTMTHYTQTHTS